MDKITENSEIQLIVEAIKQIDLEIINNGMVITCDVMARRSTLLGCLYIATRRAIETPRKLAS